jgi:hypothetical protein
MGSTQEQPQIKRREKPRSPTTGRGAASALDALIKRRAPPDPAPAPPRKNKR